MMQERTSLVHHAYHTVVIGTGTVGLISALCALGHRQTNTEHGKIAIIADRLDEIGLRQQVLWIQQDVFDFIQHLTGRKLMQDFIDANTITVDKKDGYYITTGDLERLLYNALKTHPINHYDLIQSEKITKKTKDQDAIKVDLERKSIEITVTTVNTLVYEEDSYPRMSLQFERLVVADGAKRSIFSGKA